MDWKEPDMNVSDKSKLTLFADEFLSITGHTLPAQLMCGGGRATGMNLLLSSVAVFPAKICQSLESGQGSAESAPASSGKSSGSRKKSNRSGAFSRMFQGSLALTAGKTSTPLSMRYKRAGLLSDGECWTADFSTSPNNARESSLSAVLQSKVSLKYFLSPKAAAGILRRAEKRRRTLPPRLETALKDLAATWQGEGEKTT